MRVRVGVRMLMASLREEWKRDSSTAQTDTLAGAKEEEEIGLPRSE
jgi:hypothetical protein